MDRTIKRVVKSTMTADQRKRKVQIKSFLTFLVVASVWFFGFSVITS